RSVIKKHRIEACSNCEINQREYTSTSACSKPLLGVASVLATRRINMKLTQRELAKKCGLEHHSVSRLESGENVTARTLMRISHELELQMVWLPKVVAPAVFHYLRRINETAEAHDFENKVLMK